MPQRLILIVTCVVGALLLIWPALYNGQPFFCTDTSAYIRGATAGIERLTGITTAWSATPTINAAPAPDSTSAVQSGTESRPLRQNEMPDSIMAGRSVYYGALLYAGHAAGGFWLTVLLQSLMLVAAVAVLLRSYNLLSLPTISLTVLMLCFTPAALHVSFLMPDIFSGMTILSSAMLMFGPTPSRKASTAFWFLVLAYALLTHTFNVILCLSMWAMALALYPFARVRATLTGLLLTPAALLIALSGEAAFSAGVRHFLGQAPVRPPFLMARLVGDGTGERYLRTHCSHSDLTVCRFADRLPLHFDEFLWSDDPNRGVFAIADPATKRALEAEQLRFAYAVVAEQPWEQFAASARNFGSQLLTFGAHEFTVWEGYKGTFAIKLPHDTWLTMQRSKFYLDEMPVQALTFLARVTAVAAAAYLAVGLWYSHRSRAASAPDSARLAFVVILGVLVNALISGCLSEPLDRFQARVIWLVPTMALLLDFDLRRSWWQDRLRRLWSPY